MYSNNSGSQVPMPGNQTTARGYPYSAMAGKSVLKALLPRSRPATAFWVGLFMMLAGLVLVACPLLVGVALAVAEGDQQSSQAGLGGLAVSGFFALVLVLPGVGLILVGRARR